MAGDRDRRRDGMTEQKPIKVLIVCAMGMSSSMLESKTIEAGKNAGVEVQMHAITTPDVGVWDWQANWVDVVLVAPQVRYKRKSIAQAANPLGIIVQDIEIVTFGMVDGEKLFQQVREAVRARDSGTTVEALSGR
jgi:PTS system cellobiose-specific IIB component